MEVQPLELEVQREVKLVEEGQQRALTKTLSVKSY